uniref:Mads box protein n=1 Tax=Rhizophora mucronata TaxID=61149 RepID=A0A2P2LF40_RHIMU
MTISDDEDVSLAEFLESEVLSEVSDQEEEEAAGEKAEEGEELKIKRARLGEKGKEKAPENDEEYYFNYNIINNNKNNNNKIKLTQKGQPSFAFSYDITILVTFFTVRT